MNGARRGSLLVELILLMSGGSAVLLTAILMMHRSFELSSQFRAIDEAHATYARLSSDFRSDVYGAWQVHHDSKQSIRLVDGDQTTIVYETTADAIVRTVKGAAGETRYERYRMPGSAVVEWKSESIGGEQPAAGRRVWLLIRRPVSPQLATQRLELSISAYCQTIALPVGNEPESQPGHAAQAELQTQVQP